MNNYIQLLQKWAIDDGAQIFLTLALMFIAINLVNMFSGKIVKNIIRTNGDAELEKRVNTLKYISKSFLDFLIIAAGVMIILEQLGVQIGPLLAAAGIVGVAIGFGAQRLVEDIISGFIILLDDQIRVGDVVQIAGKSGLVEKIDLKMVVLRDLEGNVHYIRNGKIDIVTNMTKDFSRYVFDIGVDYSQNIDSVIEVIKEVDEDLRRDENFKELILEPIEILGLDKFEDSAVIIKARTTTKPIKQWEVGREFNRRLKIKFDEKGIQIPFPHRTLYVKQDNSTLFN